MKRLKKTDENVEALKTLFNGLLKVKFKEEFEQDRPQLLKDALDIYQYKYNSYRSIFN